MNERVKAIGILASSYGSLERQVENAPAGMAPERIVSISYSTSRIFAVSVQHHVLIVPREA